MITNLKTIVELAFITPIQGRRTNAEIMTPKPLAVFPIAIPVSEEHLSLYTRIRLSGLFTNPEAFGSTYIQESAMSRQWWRDRVNAKGRTTLGAAENEAGQMDWMGTLSILGPELLSGSPHKAIYPTNIAEAEGKGLVEIYMLVGMWVHPDYRGNGVGKMLVERALEIIKTAPVNVQDSAEKNKDKILLLQVHQHNDAAKMLYRKAGFVKQENKGGEDEERDWMAIVIG